jgi:SulP family sulfate permease
MPHRARLNALKISSALRDSCITEKYTYPIFTKDLLAGITVAIISIPLAMALAIASGAPPQAGIYTAIIAGLVVSITGGSRLSVSGPTAALVVLLYPITEKFGFSGLIMATFMAGIIMMGMALLRLGKFVEYISDSVTQGFTTGIAVVIATLQLKDFLGLNIKMPESYIDKVSTIIHALPATNFFEASVGLLTLFILIIWPRLRLPITGHLPAALIAAIAAIYLTHLGHPIATIGSKFSYVLADGVTGNGIPPVFPAIHLPWVKIQDGVSQFWTLQEIESLLPSAFAIAMLGAIESLLCAMALDGMTDKRHHANGELLGQSLGNLLVPFFGGFASTAAIARSAANFQAGGQTPISTIINAIITLLALLLLAPLLSYLPMASMAALLMMVSWHLFDYKKLISAVTKSPSSDVTILLVCSLLTIIFNMVIAISVGVILASLLFMRDISAMTHIRDISADPKQVPGGLPEGWVVFKIYGPLFFAVAERIFTEVIHHTHHKRGIILYVEGVPLLDAAGIAALQRFMAICKKRNATVMMTDIQPQPLRMMVRAHIKPVDQEFVIVPNLARAVWMAQTNNLVNEQDISVIIF